MLWRKKTTEYKRYYYCSEEFDEDDSCSASQRRRLFEQSLDVYKPIGHFSKEFPTVILVVGSGWVGHRAFVYAQTSWWNSSGPQTIASLGCTCVCVRHRGAFCCIPSATVVGQYLAAVLAFLSVAVGFQKALVATAVLSLLMILLALGGRGSAEFDDMIEDVAKALRWLQNNKDVLVPKEMSFLKASNSSVSASIMTWATSKSSTTSASDGDEIDSVTKNTSSSRDVDSQKKGMQPPFVFGGYSSGGHVAATLLQQSDDFFSRHGLPPPEEMFKGVLMISGVLAVRPECVSLEVQAGKRGEEDKNTRDPDLAHDTNDTKFTIATAPSPSWLTNFILNVVWGDYAPKLTSPLVQSKDPALPHLLVGCKNEVFGLKLLDIFFASRQFREKVQRITGKPAKYVEVDSDHWRILNSSVLRETLRVELPNLIVS